MKSIFFQPKRIFVLLLSWGAVILCACLIFGFSNQDASQSASVSGGLLTKLLAWLPFPVSHNLLRKLAHMAEYALLGALTLHALYQTLPRRQIRPLLSLSCCAAYAVTDELHQFMIPGRACRLFDVLVDSTGALIGILAMWALVALLRHIAALWDKDGAKKATYQDAGL